MKAAFLAISICFLAAMITFAAIGIFKKNKSNFYKALICLAAVCISAAGFFLCPDAPARDSKSFDKTVTAREYSVPSPAPESETGYVASKNSDKFHRPSCASAGKIKDENKIMFATREEAIGEGYSPCSVCEP